MLYEVITYRLNLNQLEIKNGTLNYTDKEVDNTIGMKNISFLIPHIYWGGAESAADLAFDIGNEGSISALMDYDSKSGDYSGEVQLNSLALDIVLPYIREYRITSYNVCYTKLLRSELLN